MQAVSWSCETGETRGENADVENYSRGRAAATLRIDRVSRFGRARRFPDNKFPTTIRFYRRVTE
jgi:hypothetical protein